MKQEAEVEAEDGTAPAVAESEGEKGLEEGARTRVTLALRGLS